MSSRIRVVLLTILALAAAPAWALPVAPGYVVDTIDAGGTTGGGLEVIGGTVFVAVGTFGTQDVVRIASDGTRTTIATGFSSVSSLFYDAAGERLLVGDNGAEASATAGDTVYGIPLPFDAPSGPPPAAPTLELAPRGSIDGVGDVTVDPNDPTRIFVSDSESPPLPGPPGGQLWLLDAAGGTLTPIQQGLGFAAGVDASSTTLFLGESSFPDPGMVSTVLLSSVTDPLVELAGGLPGQFDLELTGDGSLLSSSTDRILAIDPLSGDVSTVATGFGFAGGVAEDEGILYALDFGLSTVFRFTPIPEPGSGPVVAGGLLSLAAWRRRAARRAGR